MSSLGAAVPSQEGLAGYLAHGGFDRHLRQLRQRFEASQAAALRIVERAFPPGTQVTQPAGGYFLWVSLPPEVDALQLHALALSHSISIAPGQLFSPDRRFSHHLRLNVGHPDDRRVEGALKTVGKLATGLAR
jgi:DNA-binding transcriptional MocR family regulator